MAASPTGLALSMGMEKSGIEGKWKVRVMSPD